MTNTVVPYSKIGVPTFEKLDNWIQLFYLAGSDPELWSYPFTVAASQTLKFLDVVGLDGSGHLIPAVYGSVAAIGVMTQDVTTGGGDTTFSVPVWRSGCFNVNALGFGASYDTAAKKKAAFEGAASPTTIALRDRPLGTPGT